MQPGGECPSTGATAVSAHTHTYASMYTHAHTCTQTCFPGLPSYPVRFPTNLELSVTHAWIC